MKYVYFFFIFCLNIGIIYCQSNDYKQIVHFIKENETNNISTVKLKELQFKWQKNKFPKDSLYGIIHYKLGQSLYMNGNHVEAQSNLEEATQIFKKNDTKISSVPKAYSLLGQNFYHLKQNKEAKFYLIESIKLANPAYHKIALSQDYLHLSSIFFEDGDFQISLENLEKGAQYAYQSKNDIMISSIENQKATIYNAIGEFDLALKYENISLKAAIRSKDKEMIARQYQMIGRIYSNKKKLDSAIANFKSAIKVLGNQYPIIGTSVQINLGYLYLTKLQDNDKALYHFQEALKIVTDPYQTLRIYNNIGYTYSQKKDFKNAFLYYQKGFRTISKDFDINDLHNNPSSELIKRAVNKEYVLTLTVDKATSWLEYYQIQKDKKKLIYARDTYLIIDKMIDYMRREHKGDESKYYWRKKTRKIYESAIETCFLINDYERAFYFFEKSRAVLLNDKLNELGARQSLNEKDKKKESQLQSEIDELRKKLIEDNTDKNQLEKKLLLVEAEKERFIKSLEKTNPAYYQLKYDTTTFELKDIQHYLKKNKVNSLVEYFIGDSATYAIVVTPNDATLKKLSVKPEEIQKFLEYSSKSIGTKTELSAFLGYSSALYKSFVQPLNIPHGRLIISQDGVFIPFEALSKSPKSSQYLLTDYAISYTYSAQILMKNQKRYGFLPNKTFLGVAPINFSSKLNSLSGSEQSLDAINKNYTLGKVLTNKSATLKNFLDDAGKYRIVQLYTHAFADSNDTEPKIYFADSALKVSDLNLTDQFKTNLLILSACKTGVGKVAKGEGVLSLARGFSMSGIASTITTLWSVEDKDTYAITELFHQFLNDGFSKDEALQKAKLSFIENNPTVVPYNWAGMVLVGNSSVINNSTELYMILFIVFLGALIGLFYKFKKTKIK